MTKEALKLALDDIVKIPTLTAGLLVKLIDVEAIINEALAQPAQDWKTTPKKNAPLRQEYRIKQLWCLRRG